MASPTRILTYIRLARSQMFCFVVMAFIQSAVAMFDISSVAAAELTSVSDVAKSIDSAQHLLFELPSGWSTSYVINVDLDDNHDFAYDSGFRGTIRVSWPLLYNRIDGVQSVTRDRHVREGEYSFETRTSIARANSDVHVMPNRHMWTAAFLFPLRSQFMSKANQYYYPGSVLETDYWLPEALTQHDYKIIGREAIIGTECVVLERAGYDKMWVAPTYGYMVLKRDVSFGPGHPLRETTLNQDIRQVSPGLWWPFQQVVKKYGGVDRPQSEWNKVVQQLTIKTGSFTVGALDKEKMHITIPDEANVSDAILGISYTRTPEGVEPFELVIEDARSRLTLPRRRSASTLMLFCWAGFGAAVLAGLFQRTNRSAAKA